MPEVWLKIGFRPMAAHFQVCAGNQSLQQCIHCLCVGYLPYKGPPQSKDCLCSRNGLGCLGLPWLGRSPESLWARRGLDLGKVLDLYRWWLGTGWLTWSQKSIQSGGKGRSKEEWSLCMVGGNPPGGGGSTPPGFGQQDDVFHAPIVGFFANTGSHIELN